MSFWPDIQSSSRYARFSVVPCNLRCVLCCTYKPLKVSALCST